MMAQGAGDMPPWMAKDTVVVSVAWSAGMALLNMSYPLVAKHDDLTQTEPC
jgi:hypothetical protein